MEIIVVSFMTSDNAGAQIACQFVATNEAALIGQVNEWFDEMHANAREPGQEEDGPDIERLTEWSALTQYVQAHAEYFSVDITRHPLLNA